MILPILRDKDGTPIDSGDMAAAAWALASRQMAEAGLRAVRSSGFLAQTRADDVSIADTPHETVFQIDKIRLFKYEPIAKPRKNTAPVVICYGLFGRQTMIDLQEDRSLVRNLLAEGIEVYVVDWGTPTRADQYLDLSDYIGHYLTACLEYAVGQNSGKPVTLFGICEGGTFAAALAATRPDLVDGLALAITPIDFHGEPDNFWPGEGFLVSWISAMAEEDVDLLIDTFGNLPGALTGAVFSSLTPINSLTKYNLTLASMEGNEAAMLNFLRMEKWIADRPDHPGEAARQWLNQLYRENRLVNGTFEIDGSQVNLARISCPVINIYAEQDHIVPVSSSKALGKFLKPDQYQEIGFPGGHVGVFVSRKAQGVVAGGLIEWLSSKGKPKKARKKKTKKS